MSTTPRRLLIFIVIALVGACRKPTPPEEKTREQKPASVEGAVDQFLEMHPLILLRLEQGTEHPTFVFSYRGKRSHLVPRISEIGIDKVGSKEPFCHIRSTDLPDQLIQGAWRFGSIPRNYTGEGCSGRLGLGEYEVYLYGPGSEGRHRLEVDRAGKIRVLPWETEETAAEARQQIKESIRRSKEGL